MSNVHDHSDFNNDYILLTPGPLTTSKTVRAALIKDWCTWDDDYNKGIVQVIRQKLVKLASKHAGYTSVLMQGSGTASVESAIGTIIPKSGAKLLIIANGAYGNRMVQTVVDYLDIPNTVVNFAETDVVDIDRISDAMTDDITHVAMVHCETTTGILNPIQQVTKIAKDKGKIMIVDAMSSFGGVPMDMGDWGIDVLISSANKCIQGVPGFGFVIARQDLLETCAGNARSLSLDLYDQWRCMEDNHGKWRFTSPTHVVRAFYQALIELEEEGSVPARNKRYTENQTILVEGMAKLGFKALMPRESQSPIITSFYSPEHADYQFKKFYDLLKADGFVIYPGKVSKADCFRIGNIGEIYPEDIKRLLVSIGKNMYWQS